MGAGAGQLQGVGVRLVQDRRRVGAAEEPGHPRQGIDLAALHVHLHERGALPSQGRHQLVDRDGGDVDGPGCRLPGDVTPGPVGDECGGARFSGDHRVDHVEVVEAIPPHRRAEQGGIDRRRLHGQGRASGRRRRQGEDTEVRPEVEDAVPRTDELQHEAQEVLVEDLPVVVPHHVVRPVELQDDHEAEALPQRHVFGAPGG